VTPHIVINEPPPPNPWIGYYNRPSDPQDASFGSRLTVPWHRVINEPYAEATYAENDVEAMVEFYDASSDDGHEWPNDDDKSDGLATVEIFEVSDDDNDYAGSPYPEDEDSCEGESTGEESDSRPETPAPETPLDSPIELRFDTSVKAAGSSHGAWLVVPGVRRRPRQLSL
jgi:hypothetical protein